MWRILIITTAITIFTSAGLMAQNNLVKGVVLDAESKEAIMAASVYIDGSMIGVSTDKEGRFELKGFLAPPYELTISSVGYKSQKLKIAQDAVLFYQLLLEPDARLLKEITVKAEKEGWAKYGNVFIESFIG